ncbi:MAG TPA: translocation/assembly module TamB domain-containing protein, partial [Gemmatimonadaceae bacterium]|nr:translocation/assembly module TamB domain-containing protein [Gemmatimonadaceae bacterium]
ALRGSWDHPRLAGRLVVEGGEVDVESVGIRLVNITGDVLVTDSSDAMKVDVRRFSMRSGGVADTLSLRGWVQLPDLLATREATFDMRLGMRNFHAIDRRSIARLDVSTGAEGIRLAGRMRGATLSGTARVDRGSIFIPDVRGKDILSADELEALAEVGGTDHVHLAPGISSMLVERLTVDGVRVEIGDEVWLRSREANVKLGGSLSVTRALDEHAAGGLGRDERPRYRLALEGALRADRGTYTLELPAVRREFQVERGTISWLGTADVTNPVLDISAMHRVKQSDRPDIGIRARLTGPVKPAPMLQLESAENYQLSQSDLVSYLVAGRPSFDAAAREIDQAQTAADVLLPTISTQFGQYLRGQFGSLLDAVQLQAGATNLGEGSAFSLESGALNFLTSARLGGEKQIRDNLYFSFSTGFCSLNREVATTEGMSFVDGLAGKLEYRFPQLSLQVGREPPASALSCGNAAKSRGVIPTPSQWGVSLSRSWRF